MNERYVIDAYAWIEYLIGSKAGENVKSVLEEDNEIYTCAATLAEVISKTAREGRNFEVAYDILVSNSQIINVDEEVSKEAGVLHSETRKTKHDFGLADAYVLAVARRMKSKVLTSDVHFKGVKEAILI
ncbi:MAG: tRNA(fMet)-specific endonuclease VapC [Candidatus Bathyarchaeota archaeon BA2]|nr:MAG: tRNA(fMet)-specific endonuclease VapC [Candidatus Bathyarchaeota archaeon BA2]